MITLGLFCCICLIGQPTEPEGFKDAFRLMEVWLDAQKDYEHLPGIAVSMVDYDQVMWSKGFGFANVEGEVKTETSTFYSICSISKLFTAIGIMQLRDKGKLRLDDEVKTHLPWFAIKQNFEDGGPITIRGLLTHSSGIPRQSNFPYWTGPDFDFPALEEIKAQMSSSETLYPASQYFQYSNFGMSLLGAIIESKSGLTYQEYMQKNILQPLDLKDTRPSMPVALAGKELAIGYSALDRDGKREPLPPFDTKGVTPAAGFTSTVEDLSKFASWQLELLDRGEEVALKSSTLKEMQRVHYMDPNWRTSWGLGFSVTNIDGTTVISHGGSCPGYRSLFSLVPQYNKAYVVMINGGGTNPGKYLEGMVEIMQKAYSADRVSPPEEVHLEDYAGAYDAQPWGSEEAVLPWFGKLIYFSLPTGDPGNFTVLQHEEKDVFVRIRENGALGEKVVFERNDEGQVYRMKQHQNFTYKKLK